MLSSLSKSLTRVVPAMKARLPSLPAGRRLLSSTAESGAPETYSGITSLLHWVSGGAAVGCVVFVQLAQNTKVNEEKGTYMFYHKSCGLLAGMLLVPRVLARLATKVPAHLPAPLPMQWGASLSHFAGYAFLFCLSGTGITMGYFGGKGLPFFATTIPGAEGEAKDGALAKQAYGIHKQAGWFFQYVFLPMHIAGAGAHVLKGDAIFARISPF